MITIGTLQLPPTCLFNPAALLQAYVLPDIVFLPTNSTVYALNEVVPQSKPRLVVSSAAVAAARGPNLPAPRQHGGQSPAARSHRRTGSGSADAHATSTPVRWQGPDAAAGPALGGLGGLPAGLPWPQAQLGAQQAAAALGAIPLVPLPLAAAAAQVSAMLQQQAGQQPGGQPPLPLLPPLPLPGHPDALPLPLQLPLLPLPPELLPPLPPLPEQPAAAAPPAAILATPQQPRLQRRAPHTADAEGEAEAETGEPQLQQLVPQQQEQQQQQQAQQQQQQAQQQQEQGLQLEQSSSPFEAQALPAGDGYLVQQQQQQQQQGQQQPAADGEPAAAVEADTQAAAQSGGARLIN